MGKLRTARLSHVAFGFFFAAVFFTTTSVLIAWTGPSSAPPNGNVAAPINVGTTNQVKNGGLSVNTLAVFGDAILSSLGGSGRHLNFGTTTGAAGYGFRDNAGVMQFKNYGGTWTAIGGGTSPVFQSFTSPGATTWTKPASGSVAFIECWGGGGSGAKVTSSTSQIAGGGGGGAYMSRWMPLSTLPASVLVTVGAGGVPATATGNGRDGSASSFGSYVVAPAGLAGIRGNANTPNTQGVGGQISPNGDLYNGGYGGGGDSAGNLVYNALGTVYGGGGGGMAGRSSGGGTYWSQPGGTSLAGGNGGSGVYSGSGNSGAQPGGGGGGTQSGTSGNGGDGQCNVTVL